MLLEICDFGLFILLIMGFILGIGISILLLLEIVKQIKKEVIALIKEDTK